MKYYIDKDALADEIKRRIENCAKQREDMLSVQCYTLADDASVRIGELNCIQDFIDTLEVKEVDFEKELDRIWFDNKFGEYFNNDAVDFARIRTIAKHFFEFRFKKQKGE